MRSKFTVLIRSTEGLSFTNTDLVQNEFSAGGFQAKLEMLSSVLDITYRNPL
jgi:hypothetical protein